MDKMLNDKKIINGKKTSIEIINHLKQQIESLKPKSIVPKLVIIIVGDDFASKIYVRNKIRMCKKIGYLSEIVNFDKNASYEEILEKINALNNDVLVHGILLQIPLPERLASKQEILLQAISETKDVDCFHYENIGKVFKNTKDCILPCTTKGILTLIQKYKIQVKGKKVVIVGSSNIAGKPTALIMMNLDATVSICNIYTNKVSDYTEFADIIILATGCINVIKPSMVKKNVIIIDVGINRDKNNKVCGDINYLDFYDKVKLITPVPGGVGPMTVASLMENLLIIYKKSLNK